MHLSSYIFSLFNFIKGGEDDDLYLRVIAKYKKVIKLSVEIARYYTHDHPQDTPNPQRHNLLGTSLQDMNQGLSTVKYEISRIEKSALFTRILVTY